MLAAAGPPLAAETPALLEETWLVALDGLVPVLTLGTVPVRFGAAPVRPGTCPVNVGTDGADVLPIAPPTVAPEGSVITVLTPDESAG
ncbi:MAG: hypothetical protein ACXWCX_25335, partial [Burkholderiales bacterium]